MNKKKYGMATTMMLAIGAIVVFIIILLSTGVLANLDVPSLTEKVPGYTKQQCPDIGVHLAGDVNVEDSAVFDLEPSISSIDVNEVKSNGRSLLQFGQEPFTYKVTGYRVDTNSALGNSFSGSAILRSGDNEGIDVPYAIDFITPDHDCNGKIDDFDVKLVAELQGADIGDVSSYSKLISFRGGSIQ